MTRKELRDNAVDRTRETGITSIVNDLINNTLAEIQAPGWAYAPRREHHHLWNFNRRKTTLTTVASQVDYEMPRDIDKIAIVRQTTSPIKLKQIPDDKFYRAFPNPTAEGNPRAYRLWEEVGTSVDLATADTIDAVSDSASDGSGFNVSVVGYRDGIKTSQVLTLDGITKVLGTITFDAGKPLRITKSGQTTGRITITAGAITLLILGKEERGARFKIISFYPIPSSEITIYLEYFTRIRALVNDSDEPDFDEKWHSIVETGVIAKIYAYKEDEAKMTLFRQMYAAGVRGMIQADITNYDYIPRLRSMKENRQSVGIIELSDDSYGALL